MKSEVRYALEGSVQRGSNRLRVNVQLIDAEPGNHLWAERSTLWPISLTCRTKSSGALQIGWGQSWSWPRRIAQNERRIRFR